MIEFVHVPVRIIEYTDRSQPGWVACELVDADNRCHKIVDKVPVFSEENIDWNTSLPQPGSLRCKVLNRYRDLADREVIRVTSTAPDGVESTEGVTEFEVLAAQLSELPSVI